MEDKRGQCEDSKTDAPSSSSSKELSKSLPEEAFNNFLQGKRHMLVQDYQFAVQSLGTACELYVKHFGELAIECGEVYFLYGKALFRLSQQQAGILGGALNEGSNEDDENSSESESKENESEKNSDQEGGDDNEIEEAEKEDKEPSESTDSPQAIIDEASSEVKAKDESSKHTEEMQNVSADEPGESKVDNQVSSLDENKTVNAEENPEAEEDDLELAWNTLETAKSIFKRQNSVESQLKVAEILQLLAEISMESDNNIAAINDLRECLQIQKKHLKPDDRILAETYYQMGLAQLLHKQYQNALENFRTTKSILGLRLENLKNTPVDESAGSFASADKDAEISDLENILLDIQEKIEDTEELICNNKKEKEDAFASGIVASPVKDKAESSSTMKTTSNITHLLKRKKPDETTNDSDSKRLKISPVPNGESKVLPSESVANTKG